MSGRGTKDTGRLDNAVQTLSAIGLLAVVLLVIAGFVRLLWNDVWYIVIILFVVGEFVFLLNQFRKER